MCWFVLILLAGLALATLTIYLDLRDARERNANLARRLELTKAAMMRHGLTD